MTHSVDSFNPSILEAFVGTCEFGCYETQWYTIFIDTHYHKWTNDKGMEECDYQRVLRELFASFVVLMDNLVSISLLVWSQRGLKFALAACLART